MSANKELLDEAAIAEASFTEPSSAQEPAQASDVKPSKAVIPVRGGIANPTDIDGQYRLAALYHKSGFLPSRFKTPEQVLTAMHFALEHFPATPLTALRQIAVIEGTPSMFGDLPLAKVMGTGKVASKEEYFVDKDWKRICVANANMGSEVFAAVCETGRFLSNGVNKHTTSFSQDDAKRAGLWGRGNWNKYPQDMLRYKARGRNLKDQFPDALNGVSQGEFDHDMTIAEADAQPVGEVGGGAGELNTMIHGRKKMTLDSEEKNG